ncbi:MAG: hypothetical protein HW382_357, partial [Deltaproteobacteria bacterium]|nr:hypothetical protein [Deltaproteobacteria bacterium]
MHSLTLNQKAHKVHQEFKQLQEKGTTVPFSCSFYPSL